MQTAMNKDDNSGIFSSADDESLIIDSDEDDIDDDDDEADCDDDESLVQKEKSALWPLEKDVLVNLHNFQPDVSKLDHGELGMNSVENRNTQRKTDTDIRIVISYMRAVNENRPPETVPPQQLDRYLSNFFTIVKKHDGNDYEPASLRGMLCSVERYLKMKNYQASVTRDAVFINTRHALKHKQQRLRELGKGGKKQNEPFGKLTLDKVNQLFSAREMGLYTPMSVINTLCFLFIVHFRLRKAIDHKNLTWGDVQLRTDPSGKEYLIYEPRSSVIQEQRGKPIGTYCKSSSKLCIWGQPDVPERNPVGIYKTYRDKRPGSMLFDSSPFYLGITTLHPSPVQAWYRTCAMGVNKLSDLVRMIRDITGLPRATIQTPTETILSETYKTPNIFTSPSSYKASLSVSPSSSFTTDAMVMPISSHVSNPLDTTGIFSNSSGLDDIIKVSTEQKHNNSSNQLGFDQLRDSGIIDGKSSLASYQEDIHTEPQMSSDAFTDEVDGKRAFTENKVQRSDSLLSSTSSQSSQGKTNHATLRQFLYT